MPATKTIFAQVIELLHPEVFSPSAKRYREYHNVKEWLCSDQFVAIAQMAYRERSREIETCLQARSALLYHMGYRGRVVRTPLANAYGTGPQNSGRDILQALMGRSSVPTQ